MINDSFEGFKKRIRFNKIYTGRKNNIALSPVSRKNTKQYSNVFLSSFLSLKFFKTDLI